MEFDAFLARFIETPVRYKVLAVFGNIVARWEGDPRQEMSVPRIEIVVAAGNNLADVFNYVESKAAEKKDFVSIVSPNDSPHKLSPLAALKNALPIVDLTA